MPRSTKLSLFVSTKRIFLFHCVLRTYDPLGDTVLRGLEDPRRAFSELQVRVRGLLRLAESALHRDVGSCEGFILDRDDFSVDEMQRSVLRRECLGRLVRELEEAIAAEPGHDLATTHTPQ